MDKDSRNAGAQGQPSGRHWNRPSWPEPELRAGERKSNDFVAPTRRNHKAALTEDSIRIHWIIFPARRTGSESEELGTSEDWNRRGALILISGQLEVGNGFRACRKALWVHGIRKPPSGRRQPPAAFPRAKPRLAPDFRCAFMGRVGRLKQQPRDFDVMRAAALRVDIRSPDRSSNPAAQPSACHFRRLPLSRHK